jgi:hypothetical protein
MPATTYQTRSGVSVDEDGYILLRPGWRDNLASFSQGRIAGANVPTWSQVVGGIYAYDFSPTAMNEIWLNFHVDHDYCPGSVMYPHVHFLPSDNNAGVVRWGIEYMVAKGHGQQAFPGSTTTVYLDVPVAANSLRNHIISETSLVDAIPATNLEPDAVILCRYFRDAAHGNDTYGAKVWGIYGDLHYLSDRLSTASKAPDFYNP